MLATQQKIGLPMVELLLVELDYLRLTTLVVGMAVAADALLFRQPAVIAATGLDIATHLLVAIQAEPDLRGTVEAHVAVATIGFLLGMSGNDLPRHDGGFDVLRLRRP